MIIKLFITLMVWNPELGQPEMTATQEYVLPFDTYAECLEKAEEVAEWADQEELVLGINASCIKLPGEGGRDA